MGKVIFDADDIHAVRIKLEERRSKMTREEAQRDFDARVERGRNAIAEARKKNLVREKKSL